jgi:hypothetical protein
MPGQFVNQAETDLDLVNVLGLRPVDLDARIDGLALEQEAAIAADVGDAEVRESVTLECGD